MGTIKIIEAHAKLLLSGEHSVLRGAPAVGLPLPLRLRLAFNPHLPSAEQGGSTRDHTDLPDRHRHLRTKPTKESADRAPTAKQLFSPTARQLLADYPRFIDEVTRSVREATRSNGGSIDIESEIPLGAGLGSSAALCVACAELLQLLRNDGGHERAFGGRGDESELQTVWRKAHHMERHFHGRSSGVDTGIIANTTPVIFWHTPEARHLLQTKGRGIIADPSTHYRIQPLKQGVSLTLAIIVLPRKPATSARKMIDSVAEERNREIMQRFCKQTERFAEQCAELAATTPDPTTPSGVGTLPDTTATERTATSPLPAEFYECVRQLHRLQQQLGISTTEIDAFIEQACAHGAEAGKVSGAGGGGAAFVLFRNHTALASALPQLTRFCDTRYQQQHRLYSGEWHGNEWHGFREHRTHPTE